MGASLKQKDVLPTPFQSPERAALAAAIVKAAGADARRAALAKAVTTADAEVRAARRAVEATAEAIEVAKSNVARHLTDTALGTAGAAPQTFRQARAAAIEAADHLEACLAAREALQSEQVDVHGLAALSVQNAAVAVLRAEVGKRGVALATRVDALQRELVALGSELEWLFRKGAVPQVEKDDPIRDAVRRLDSTPRQWTIGDIYRHHAAFAQPVGAQRWQAAFEALKRDANAALPED
jgi:hypothetical protein